MLLTPQQRLESRLPPGSVQQAQDFLLDNGFALQPNALMDVMVHRKSQEVCLAAVMMEVMRHRDERGLKDVFGVALSMCKTRKGLRWGVQGHFAKTKVQFIALPKGLTDPHDCDYILSCWEKDQWWLEEEEGVIVGKYRDTVAGFIEYAKTLHQDQVRALDPSKPNPLG